LLEGSGIELGGGKFMDAPDGTGGVAGSDGLGGGSANGSRPPGGMSPPLRAVSGSTGILPAWLPG
jgi:hypothetical protein